MPINMSRSGTCNMYARASANPRISPCPDPIHHHVATPVRCRFFFIVFFFPDVVRLELPRKNGRGARERPARRIETKCTATTTIIDTRSRRFGSRWSDVYTGFRVTSCHSTRVPRSEKMFYSSARLPLSRPLLTLGNFSLTHRHLESVIESVSYEYWVCREVLPDSVILSFNERVGLKNI